MKHGDKITVSYRGSSEAGWIEERADGIRRWSSERGPYQNERLYVCRECSFPVPLEEMKRDGFTITPETPPHEQR